MMNIFKNRKFRYGSYAIIVTIAVIAIAILLNAIVSTKTIREALKFDFTQEKLYSIGDKTKDLLSSLDKNVIIFGIFDYTKLGIDEAVDPQYQEVVEFLKQYEKNSSRIEVKYVDPDRNPGFIKEEIDPQGVMDIQKGDFVVKSGDKIKVLTSGAIFKTEFDQYYYTSYKTGSTAEQAFTGAIKYVIAEDTPKVCFVTGHGEGVLERDYS